MLKFFCQFGLSDWLVLVVFAFSLTASFVLDGWFCALGWLWAVVTFLDGRAWEFTADLQHKAIEEGLTRDARS